MNSETTIRVLDRAGTAQAIDWAAEEGWNPGLDDLDAFRDADPNGLLGLFIDDQIAATISAVGYGPSFAFIGFYICRKDLRGRGYGKRLWDAALQRLGKSTVGLDGVVAQQANYAKSGFRLAHRNIRYAGRPPPKPERNPKIVELGDDAPESLAELIVAYDRPFFPAPRDTFVRAWIDGEGAERRTLAFIEDRTVRGYGTIRRCRDGYKIGPLFAENAEIAAALFAALAGALAGATVILDVPEPNEAARALAEGQGMKPVFETARMYRGVAPALPLDKTFGITTFELG